MIGTYIDKIVKKNGHHPKILEFFENIMFDRSQPIKENMEKIVNVIFDSSFKYDFLHMKENSNDKGDYKSFLLSNSKIRIFNYFKNNFKNLKI
jgi:hypothetical protein